MAVLSKVTADRSVVAVTCVPDLQATSVKSIVNATAPFVSPEAITYEAVYVFVPVSAIVAVFPAIVADIVDRASEAVMVIVTVSQTFAFVVSELSEAIVTTVNVGAATSGVKEYVYSARLSHTKISSSVGIREGPHGYAVVVIFPLFDIFLIVQYGSLVALHKSDDQT